MRLPQLFEMAVEKLFEVGAGQLFEMEAGQLFEVEAGQLFDMEAGQFFEMGAAQLFEIEAGQLVEIQALCRIKLLPVTYVLVDTWMLTFKPVYKLLNMYEDLKWTTNTRVTQFSLTFKA